MTVPAGRITQASSPEEWQRLKNQWESERKPGWVVQRAGAISYQVIQTSDGELAFDPVDNRGYYESTTSISA